MASRINMATWPRQKHFQYFMQAQQPQYVVNTRLNVAPLAASCTEQTKSLHLAFIHAITTSALAIPALCQRIRPDGVWQLDRLSPSTTVLGDAQLFGFCRLPYHTKFTAFCQTARPLLDKTKAAPTLTTGEPQNDETLYLSALPWFDLTGFQHPVFLDRHDAVPRISWGQVQTNGELGLSIQVHHGLVDGVHLGEFMQQLTERCQQPNWLD